MSTATAWQAGAATDTGVQRTVNEDRVFVDELRGIFLVVDGLGGHAAGELASETAVRVIAENAAGVELTRTQEDLEEKIRESITEANNQIYALAQSNESWRGMACVLTLAVAREDRVTVGHVGDTRLYLIWNGNLRKLTSDHSPVGEREDHGELTEEEAMRHPRRNEVFRDVGSQLREAHDRQFIEIRSFLFRPDAALLLCSDGLTDVLTSAQISAIIERYDGHPEETARRLVDAANDAGGKDNVSAVLVAGPEFIGSESRTLVEARPRHAVTRMKGAGNHWRAIVIPMLWLLAGMAAGMLLWGVLERMIPRPAPPQKAAIVERAPAHIAVNPADPLGIINALSIARAGDTVDVPAGQYLGPIQLKEHVNVLGDAGGEAIVRSNPASVIDTGVAVIAQGIQDGRVQN
ncbi:MAG: protein phosphatase 2C domain-containing protein, partial [Bryobacteraceae bacterium]